MPDAIRILLVEDNPHDRTLIRRSLEKDETRFELVEITAQQQLDEQLAGEAADLVISDYRLGWTNGVTVLESIKASWPACPVIMFTVMGSEEIAVEAMKAGLDDYVLKSPSQFTRMPEIVKGLLDRKAKEDALERAEERYRALFEGMPIGLFRVESGGNIIEGNQALLDILGYPDMQTLVNTNANEIYVNDEQRTQLLDLTAAYGTEIRLRRYDKSIMDAKIYARRVEDSSRTIRYYEGSIEDITERKRVEREREQSLKAEKKRAEELSTLTSIATMVSSTLDIGEMLKVIAEQITHLFDVESCLIARWDPESETRQMLVEYHSVQVERDITDLFIPHEMGAKWPKTTSVINQQQPVQVHITDPGLPAASIAYLKEQGLQSVLMVPLVVQDQVTGIVELESFSQVRVFTEQEISLALTLCQQAAVALENARLFEKTNSQLQELEVLHAITSFAVEAQDENQFLEYCTRLISRTYNWHIFGVLLMDREQGLIKSHSSYISGTTSQLQVPVGIGITGEVARSGEPLYVPDTSVHKNYLNFNMETRAEYCVPLKIDGEVIGVLNAESKKLDGISPSDRQIVNTLARQISIILQRIRAQALSVKHVRQLEILNVLGSQMTGLYSQQELYSTVCERLVDKFGYYCCAILSVDMIEQQVRLEYLAGGNFSEDVKAGEFSQLLNVGLIGQAVLKREPVLSNNVAEDETYVSWGDENIISEIEVPLIVEDEIIGVMMISDDRPNAFLSTDVSALRTIADQLAMGVEKTRLFETERSQRRNAEMLRQVATMLSNTIDTDQRQMLEMILQKLKTVVDYNSATIFLIEGDRYVAEAHYGIPNVVTTGEFSFSLDENRIMYPVVNNFETRLFKDVRHDPDWIEIPDANYISAWIAAPLIVRQHCVGVLTVDGAEVGAFSQNDADMVTAIAGQAATAIENAHLFNEISDALEREQQLNLIAHRLSEGLQFKDVIEEVIVLACQAVGGDASTLALISPDGEHLDFKYRYHFGVLGEEFRVKKDEGISWDVIQSGHSLMVRNYQEHTKALSDVEVRDLHALIVVPVHAGDLPIGAFGIYSYNEKHSFSHRDLELIETVGRQLGVAIYNGQLYNQTVLALEREQQLNEITRVISNTLETQSILEEVVKQAVELVGGTSSMLILCDPETKASLDQFSFNMPPQLMRDYPGKGEGVYQQVLETGKSLLLNNYASHSRAQKAVADAGIRSVIMAPIKYQEATLGVLMVGTDDPNTLFTLRDLELVETVSRQAAVAMNNAQLFAETVKRTKELSTLYEFALATGSILDLDALLEQLYQKVRQLLSPDSFRVLIHDQESEQFEIVMAIAHDSPLKKIEGRKISLDKGGLMGWILQNRQPLLVRDTETEKLPEKPLYTVLTGRSYLGVPLLVHENLIGAMIVQGEQPNKFDESDSRVLESLASQVAIAMENAQLYEEIEESFVQTVLALANAMDARDNYTRDHSQRISLLAVEVGRELGFSEQQLEELRWAALLHDIGKIGVPDDILLKPEKLTEAEYEMIKQHPVLGAKILEPVKKLADVAPLVRGHQEWYNGQGYPDGLKGEDIPQGARILSVVDSYIAMTDERIYRSARTHEEALKELVSLKGVQFDPEVVDIFVNLLKKSSLRKKSRRSRSK